MMRIQDKVKIEAKSQLLSKNLAEDSNFSLTYNQSKDLITILRDGKDFYLPYSGKERTSFNDIENIKSSFKNYYYINKNREEVSEYYPLSNDMSKDSVEIMKHLTKSWIKLDDNFFTSENFINYLDYLNSQNDTYNILDEGFLI
ncbi:MAG: hypothetical protein J0H68_04275 [Sphingobacteriia bacterium]|nr:hypothetical protein [Sphingobacteriia bacterium]